MKNESFSDTKVNLKLGDNTYTVNFGIYTSRRIEEAKPKFNILSDDMPDFEIIPFLIQNGIEPEDRKWETEKEFIQLYDNCKDEENLKRIPLAYQNAVGFTNQRFEPLIKRLSTTISESQKATTPTTKSKR
jgi:hypothetical protein